MTLRPGEQADLTIHILGLDDRRWKTEEVPCWGTIVPGVVVSRTSTYGLITGAPKLTLSHQRSGYSLGCYGDDPEQMQMLAAWWATTGVDFTVERPHVRPYREDWRAVIDEAGAIYIPGPTPGGTSAPTER